VMVVVTSYESLVGVRDEDGYDQTFQNWLA